MNLHSHVIQTPVDSKTKKTGAACVIVGRQGSGKTPTVKEYAKKSGFKNKIVYDPRYEYEANEYTQFHNVENFKDYVLKCRNSFIIVEEASGFISSFRNQTIDEWLIAVQHYRNIIFFLFHSLEETPLFIIRKCQYIILLELNSNDTYESVKRTRPSLAKHFYRKRPTFIDNYKNY